MANGIHPTGFGPDDSSRLGTFLGAKKKPSRFFLGFPYLAASLFFKEPSFFFKGTPFGSLGTWETETHLAAQKPGIPKWVALVSGNMDQNLRN